MSSETVTWYRVSEAAVMLGGVHPQTIRRWIKLGLFPWKRYGPRNLFVGLTKEQARGELSQEMRQDRGELFPTMRKVEVKKEKRTVPPWQRKEHPTTRAARKRKKRMERARQAR